MWSFISTHSQLQNRLTAAKKTWDSFFALQHLLVCINHLAQSLRYLSPGLRQ